MGVAIYVSFLQKNGGSFRSRTHHHEPGHRHPEPHLPSRLRWRVPLPCENQPSLYPPGIRHILRSATTTPFSPPRRECVSPLASVSGVSTCVDIDGLYFFFPTNLSQIRRVINLRRARLPRPTHLAINVAFIGTPVRPVVALFALGPRIEGCPYVVYKIDCSNFLPYLYILQSSLIQIK